MSVIENQTLDQIQGVDTDAAFNQTAAKLSGGNAVFSDEYVKGDGSPNYCACEPDANYVCDACAQKLSARTNTQPTDGSFAAAAKKPHKPRQPKKADPVLIAESIQDTLFLGRKAATDKIKKRLLLRNDYEEAFWHLHAVTTDVLQKTVAICGNSINHLLDIQASQAKELQDGEE